MSDKTRAKLALCTEIPAGQAKVVQANEQRLAVCNVDGQYFVIDDVCTHDGGPLGEGRLFGPEIECPRHGARFDVRTGNVTRMPAVRPVKTHPVEIDDGAIYVELDEAW